MAARTRYAPDRGLTVRMTVTMFLLGLVFVAFIAAIIGIGTAYGASSTAIVFFAVILGGGFAIGSLFYSDKIALATAGAQRGKPDRLTGSCAPARHRGPALRAGRHAQAEGRDRRHRHAERVRDRPQRRPRGGLRDQGDPAPLENDELEGVLAHEMSHVAHKDVQVMTIASFLAIIAALLVRIAFYGELFGGGRRSNDSNAGVVMLALMAVSIVVYAVSFLLIRLLSRYRELSADRSGALLTGRPSSLKSALVKVTGDIARIPTKDLRASQPLNAFFFTPAAHLSASSSKLANAFSTHPSLERRLAELDKVQQQLGRTAG
jgi:Zn-dependent protease with chaperone function